MNHENIDHSHLSPVNDSMIKEEIDRSKQPLIGRIERGGSGEEGQRQLKRMIGEVATIVANNPERVALDAHKRAHGNSETTIHDPAKAYVVAHAIHKDMSYIAKHKKRPAFLQRLTQRKRDAAEEKARFWAGEAERAYNQEPLETAPLTIELARSGHYPIPPDPLQQFRTHENMPTREEIDSVATRARTALDSLQDSLQETTAPGARYKAYQSPDATKQLLIQQDFTPPALGIENDNTLPAGTYVKLQNMRDGHSAAESTIGVVFMNDGRTLLEQEDRVYYGDSKLYINVLHTSPKSAMSTLTTFAEGLEHFRE